MSKRDGPNIAMADAFMGVFGMKRETEWKAMKSKVKSHAGRRAKGATGERQAAKDIMAHCPGILAERNARNGKATSDVVIWREGQSRKYLLEVKRVESLDLGTVAMEKIRLQSVADDAIGVLWRPNGKAWRLEAWWHPVGWATYSGASVWKMLAMLIEHGESSYEATQP